MLSTRFDAEDDGFATGIGACLTKNNESKPTANFAPNANLLYTLGTSSLGWKGAFFDAGTSAEADLIFDNVGTWESPDDRSGFRYHGKGFSGGMYFSQSASNGAINISRDAEFDGTNWIARNTEAGMIRIGTGEDFSYYSDSSLTAGNSFTPTLRWNVTNVGNLTTGTVPLARMGTSVLDSSTAVTAGNATNLSIQAQVNSHRFYKYSIRGSAGLAWTEGAQVLANETVDEGPHSWIERATLAVGDKLLLTNGTTSSSTCVYKMYELTET